MMEQAIHDYGIQFDPVLDESTTEQHTTVISSLWAKHVTISSGISSSLTDEIYRFQSINIKFCDDDILTFWQSQEKSYPRLSKIAKVLLGVPITSSKAESAFSIAGCLIRKDRASLDPFRIEKALFVHDNYDLFKFKV